MSDKAYLIFTYFELSQANLLQSNTRLHPRVQPRQGVQQNRDPNQDKYKKAPLLVIKESHQGVNIVLQGNFPICLEDDSKLLVPLDPVLHSPGIVCILVLVVTRLACQRVFACCSSHFNAINTAQMLGFIGSVIFDTLFQFSLELFVTSLAPSSTAL